MIVLAQSHGPFDQPLNIRIGMLRLGGEGLGLPGELIADLIIMRGKCIVHRVVNSLEKAVRLPLPKAGRPRRVFIEQSDRSSLTKVHALRGEREGQATT